MSAFWRWQRATPHTARAQRRALHAHALALAAPPACASLRAAAAAVAAVAEPAPPHAHCWARVTPAAQRHVHARTSLPLWARCHAAASASPSWSGLRALHTRPGSAALQPSAADSHEQQQHQHQSHSHSSGLAPRSRWRPLALLLAGGCFALWLVRDAAVRTEGSHMVQPPSSLSSAAASGAAGAASDPLAEHRLPALIKEHRKLGLLGRLWFYVRVGARGALLACVWLPVLLSGLVLPTRVWMKLVLPLLERCGAVFIKLGQWAATRPDLFPQEMCDALAALQAQVRPHKFKYTLEQCRANFGPDLVALDEQGRRVRLEVEEAVLGSGSMGQVHHGYLVAEDGARTEVAIKCLHPGIHSRVNLDLTLLYFVAAAITKIPYSELQWVSIPEMLIQFTDFMSSHLDLIQEASNMDRFRAHFADNRNILFPKPMRPFVGPQVLVQQLEHGIPLGKFLHAQELDARHEHLSELLASKNKTMRERLTRRLHLLEEAARAEAARTGQDPAAIPTPLASMHTSPLHSEIARLGLQMYLHMLISDNFVHSDLHPGNLLVAFPSHPLQGEGEDADQLDQMDNKHLRSEDVSLVVLDSGLVSELSPKNRRNFLSLFGALILRDGRLAARLMLDNAPAHSCTDPAALQEDMHVIVSAIPLENLASVDLGRLLSEVMNCVRRHHVKLESDFASLVISLAIIEGIGRQLDPHLSLFHQAVPIMLRNAETRNIIVQTAGLKACMSLGLIIAKEEMQLLHKKLHQN